MDDQTGEEINGGMDSSLPCETIIEHTLDDLEMFCRRQEGLSREFMLRINRLHPENVTPADVVWLINIAENTHLFTRDMANLFRREAIALRIFRQEIIADAVARISGSRQQRAMTFSWFTAGLLILFFGIGYILAAVLI